MSNGIPECRQAVTRWIKKRYNADVDSERITIMPGWQTYNALCNSMLW
jgi:aspartate/methionine/tyrosine aminotransferase